jgi:hypothetical protein
MVAAVAHCSVLLSDHRHGRWRKRRVLPEHGSLVLPQTRTETERQLLLLAGLTPSEIDGENDTQALPGIEFAESHEKERNDTEL